MIEWLKSMFHSDPPPTESVVVKFRLPDGKEFGVEAIQPPKYLKPDPKCKKHWDYIGVSIPTNNCNECWEYYSQKMNRKIR